MRLILILAGIALMIAGAYLISLGGSFLYLPLGVLTLFAGVASWKRPSAALLAYAALLLLTLIWGVAESGLYGWALMPRLLFWIVGGIVVGLALRRAAERRAVLALAAVLAVSTGVFAVSWFVQPALQRFHAAPAAAGGQQPSGEWLHYGGALGGGRFSTMSEITPANVHTLEPAWTYRPGQTIPGGKRKGGLQVTPLMVDGLVYGCTAFNSVFALDPASGKEVWRFNPRLDPDAGGHPACRGLAFFRAPAGISDCPTRLLFGTIDNRLLAIDARTGRPCRGFGRGGQVSLWEGMGNFPRRWSHPTSPPTIVNGVAVIGAYVADNQSTKVPPGVIRGYDAVTGALRWAFDAGRPNDPRPPQPGATYTPSTPNAWTIFSGDEAAGLVFVPMGNGSPDFLGGHRTPETERFTSSLVALEAATGRVRWSFQAVHHDLWDYDLAAQPVLTDFPMGSSTVPAVILPTKTGQLFVLDRRTGRPLTKVEERAVPQSALAGERSSPTQPFSTGMPDMAGEMLRERHMWGLTPFDQLWCRIKFRQASYQGMYTPPKVGATIRYPGELGGIDWGSVAIDASRGILIVNSNHMADYDRLITRAEALKVGLVAKRKPGGHSAPGGAMEGTPYAIQWGPFISGLGVPCQQPPFGFLTAIDLKTRRVIWTRTLGDARNSGPFGIGLGLPLPLGAPNIGGSVTTASGLTFIAATQDEMFRAVDTSTGRILWQRKLPVAGHATPMTYRGPDGRQYVVIAAGGGSLRNRSGDFIIAFRLK